MNQGRNREQQAQILDGLETGAALIRNVRASIARHVEAGNPRPGLAVVLVGKDPASSIYVNAKRRDCEKAGPDRGPGRPPGRRPRPEGPLSPPRGRARPGPAGSPPPPHPPTPAATVIRAR